LFQISNVNRFNGLVFTPVKSRQQERGENANDGNRDQQLDKGKSTPLSRSEMLLSQLR
jgi:hypothetical protein